MPERDGFVVLSLLENLPSPDVRLKTTIAALPL